MRWYTHNATKFDHAVRRCGGLYLWRMLDPGTRERLKERLDQVHEWPSLYMFKLIFEPEKERLQKVLDLFPPESEILRKYSAGGKYLSVTVREVMMSADEVVERYAKAADIQGVIML